MGQERITTAIRYKHHQQKHINSITWQEPRLHSSREGMEFTKEEQSLSRCMSWCSYFPRYILYNEADGQTFTVRLP